MSRYMRQMILPEVGPQGQAALGAAHVVVVGTGGLAAPALPYLVGAGIGHLTLVDHDTVSLSNLHRQTLFREEDVGRTKVEAAAASLRALNRDCQITCHSTALTPATAPGLVAKATLFLDCADSFAVSYVLSDACHAAGLPLFTASVLGLTGYVGGFCGGAPSLRAVFPDLPDRAASCSTAGVMGPVVGMLGAAQAQMAINHILGLSPSPLGQMLSFDLQTYRMSGFRFDSAPEPTTGFRFIETEAIAAKDFVIELRDRSEAQTPIAPHAQRSDVDLFASQKPRPQDGQRAVFACRSGLRAWQAATHLNRYWDGEIVLVAVGDTRPD